MPAYSEQRAAAFLGEWVECGWTLESKRSLVGHGVAPDGCVDIIYDLNSGLRVVGTMTVEQRFHFPNGAYVAGVRFRPGMSRAFLRISPSELTDGSLPLEHLWPRYTRQLTDRLDNTKSIHDAARLLLGSMPRIEAPLNSVQRAIRTIVAAHGNVNLERIASHANLSPRQFRRRCMEESGVTPKLLCRILRFRHACHLSHATPKPNWPAIALEAAYFDQAHFIRDFREFTGRTPMSVFSNTGTAPRP